MRRPQNNINGIITPDIRQQYAKGISIEHYARLMFYAKLAQNIPSNREPARYSIIDTSNNNELTTELFASELEFKLKNSPQPQMQPAVPSRKHGGTMRRLRRRYQTHNTRLKIKRLKIKRY